MKLKVTGLVLSLLATVFMMVPAFAATPSGSVTTAAAGYSQSASLFSLDGSAMGGLTYQAYHGVYYITVESFVTAMDRDAVVVDENGTVTVDSCTFAGVAAVPSGSFFVPEGVVSHSADAMETGLSLTAVKGACYAQANGRYLYVKDGVKVLDGKVALPVRVLAKVFNLTVAYDPSTKGVALTRQQGAGVYLEEGDSFYDGDTLYWLSRIIYSESGNQSMAGKIAVGNVVMNRVASPKFPDNIYDVLFQKNQFSPAASGSIYREPNAASVIAAKLVLDGAVSVNGALFFNRAGMNTYAARTRTYVTTIGAHAFFK